MSKKDKFAELPEEWKDAVASMQDDKVNKSILDAAMNMVVLEAAKELDEDLKALKEQVTVANEVYKDGKKQNLLKIEYGINILRARGVNVPGVQDFIKKGRSSLDGSEG